MPTFTDGLTALNSATLNQCVTSHDGTTNIRTIAGYFAPAASPTWVGHGVSGIVKNSTGNYTLTFDGALSTELECSPNVIENSANCINRGVVMMSLTTTFVILQIYAHGSPNAVSDDVDYVTVKVTGTA
jgi:hypothetical protein